MAKRVTFASFQDFLRHNWEHMEKHFYVYFHVFKLLPRLRSQQVGVYAAYNIVDDYGHQIIALHVTGSYYLFSFGWTAPMLELLATEVEVGKCKSHFELLGQRDLVLELLQKHNRQWRVFKERLVYQCEAVTASATTTAAVVENAAYEDGEELVKMSWAFDREEYPDKARRYPEQAYGQVQYGIETNNLFVVREAGDLCGMLQVIQTEGFDRPILGTLYTLPKHRNKGYATLLLSTVTAGLLKSGYEVCGLLSDITNPASNKAFVKVGYRPVYQWLNVAMV